VGDSLAAPRLAEVAQRLGTERTLVVHGAGVDELPLDGSGVVLDVTPRAIDAWTVDRTELASLGLMASSNADLAGGEPEENASLVEAVLGGAPGPHRDVVTLNAGAAFLASGRVSDLAAGLAAARTAIDDGRATGLLARLRAERITADATRAAADAERAAAETQPAGADARPAGIAPTGGAPA
jgi:anthranilate phosphoribosyltransferase